MRSTCYHHHNHKVLMFLWHEQTIVICLICLMHISVLPKQGYFCICKFLTSHQKNHSSDVLQLTRKRQVNFVSLLSYFNCHHKTCACTCRSNKLTQCGLTSNSVAELQPEPWVVGSHVSQASITILHLQIKQPNGMSLRDSDVTPQCCQVCSGNIPKFVLKGSKRFLKTQ